MNDHISQFREAIMAAGMMPPDVIVPGEYHRFPGVDKSNGNTAGWCQLFADGLGGCFGDWSSGFSEVWQAKRKTPFSQSERAAFMRRVEEEKRRREAELHAKQAKAAIEAQEIWRYLPPASPFHTYLTRKRIKAYGAREDRSGRLLLPITDFSECLTSLQFIDSLGNKRLLTGGRKRGCFIPVAGGMANPARVIICEGWATGCTLAEDEPDALVLAAIDAGNLEPVAVAARSRWPHTELVIAGDDDRQTAGNPGATKARAAAIASGALLALPPWPEGAPLHLTDFNDLATWLKTNPAPPPPPMPPRFPAPPPPIGSNGQGGGA